jgi:hypothetical protein
MCLHVFKDYRIVIEKKTNLVRQFWYAPLGDSGSEMQSQGEGGAETEMALALEMADMQHDGQAMRVA